MVIRQVITERDWFVAQYDYMAEQIDGRFRLQFPSHGEVLDAIVEDLRDPLIRLSVDAMKQLLRNNAATLSATLTDCTIEGCLHPENHELVRELLNLVWDVRSETESWLNRQGIVPGRSTN